jgi:hypothetical protein
MLMQDHRIKCRYSGTSGKLISVFAEILVIEEDGKIFTAKIDVSGTARRRNGRESLTV